MNISAIDRNAETGTLDEIYDYFNSRRDELAANYHGKHAVVKNRLIAGVYDTFFAAYEAATAVSKLGEFLIQPCVTLDEELDMPFTSGAVEVCEEEFV